MHHPNHDITCHRRESSRVLVVRCEVFTTLTMKNAVFWDVTPCGSCKNRLFGGMCRRFHRQAEKNQRARENVSNN
jgi:hypothetical protein